MSISSGSTTAWTSARRRTLPRSQQLLQLQLQLQQLLLLELLLQQRLSLLLLPEHLLYLAPLQHRLEVHLQCCLLQRCRLHPPPAAQRPQRPSALCQQPTTASRQAIKALAQETIHPRTTIRRAHRIYPPKAPRARRNLNPNRSSSCGACDHKRAPQ